MPNGIRDKRPFLDVAYDGAFSAYATIEKRPVAFLNLWGSESRAKSAALRGRIFFANFALEFTHFLTAETHLTPMNKGEGAFS